MEVLNASWHLEAEERDFFHGVWSNQALNKAMGFVYFSGLIFCIGLLFVSWFERSGEAGPFRTLVNRLVSFMLDQVKNKNWEDVELK